ncbi:MAG TPA: asparagine synthase [Gammaproteobacteria bacterium]|nr:asparagine synthase [Gammaproteobacteria bacterium]
MIELFGYIGGGNEEREALDRFLAKTPTQYQVRTGSRAMVAVHSLFQNVQIADEKNVTAVLVGRPRDRERQASILARDYIAKGQDALQMLHGSYVGAVLDLSSGKGCAFVDRVATWPLYYAVLPRGGLAFSTRMDVLHQMGVSRKLRFQALYDYLYFHVVPAPQTVYEEVSSLRPGRAAVYRNIVEELRYWRLAYQEDGGGDFGALKDELLALLEKAVGRVADGRVGAFLSGGTDSSTVTGMLGRVHGQQPPRTFSIGFDEPGYDELDFARTSAACFGAEPHEYKVTPADIVEAIPLIARAYEQPFGNSSAVPTYFCARMAADAGIERLLAGDGGDELFAGNSRYAKQHMLQAYHRLPEGGRRGLVEPLLASFLGELPGLRKVRSYVNQARIPMPERMETYNLLERLGPESVLTEDFLSQVDRRHPLQVLSAAYGDSNADTLLNRMLALDYQITLADNDLQKVSRMCAMAGVEVAYPLLDDEIVAFSAKLPPGMKLKGGKLRWFFKSALSDFLPQQVLTKKKQGFGLPFGPWMNRHAGLAEMVGDSLSDLRKRRLVRNEVIDRLTNDLVSDHPGYYGTLVWVLVMLEQWFVVNGQESF